MMSAGKYKKELARYIDKNFGSQSKFSKVLGFYGTIVSDCCSGKRHDKKLAQKMGYRVKKKVTIYYEPIEGEEQCF